MKQFKARIKIFNVKFFILNIFLLTHVYAQTLPKAPALAFSNAINVENIRKHQKALYNIALANNNNRMTITKGYKDSVAYVKSKLEEFGYEVELQNFSIGLRKDKSPPELEVIEPIKKHFEVNIDFSSMTGQGSQEVIGTIEAIKLKIPSSKPNDSNSGCKKSHFENFSSGNIALIQRGSCTFKTKVKNAIDAKASGIIIFNEGNPNRKKNFKGRIPKNISIPVLSASFNVGKGLSANTTHGPTGILTRVKVDVTREQHRVNNVIAETKQGSENRSVVIGAHLDSVISGPGINDNGSGSAAILEIALKYKEFEHTPKNKLRFIWFGAEEFGLLGAKHYVDALNNDEQKKIMAMLNFDMIGSSNYVRFIYDGDGSLSDTAQREGPKGSDFIEKVFKEYFKNESLAFHETTFNGRSDYGPFIEMGIPAGGLFSGAEGIKTKEQEKIYGGKAYKPFDPCYHHTCDDFAHTGGNERFRLAIKSLDELSSAAAYAVFFMANTTKKLRPPDNENEPKAKTQMNYQGPYLIR